MLIDSLSSAELDDQDLETVPAWETSNAELWDDVFESHYTAEQSLLLNVSQQDREVSDVPRVQAAHSTAGYRDGMAAAKAEYVQAGFDEGYGLGGELGRAVGWILGAFEGLVATASSGRKRVQVPGEDNTSASETRNGPEKLGQAGEKAKEMLAKARTELDAGKVFGKEYITEEGIWKWNVDETESNTIVFQDIAMKHPLIVKWRAEIGELVKEFGFDLNAQL